MSIMTLEAVDLTTAPFIFDPEQAFKVAGKINRDEPDDAKKIGIEVYPIRNGWDIALGTIAAWPGVKLLQAMHKIETDVKPSTSAKKVKIWQNRHNAQAIRVHQPWMYNLREMLYQAFEGDWFPTPVDRVRELALMHMVGAATNRFGEGMAHELGIGMNIHPNVLEGYVIEGKLDQLKAQVPFIYGENSVAFNSLWLRDREVLGDPRATVRHDVVGQNLDGFLFAIDHMFGLEVTDDPEFIADRIRLIREMSADPLIQEHTKAIHISRPGHGAIHPNDPVMEDLLGILAQTPFRNPVRIALDINPFEIAKMDETAQYNYVKSVREWMFETIDKNN